MRSRRPRLLTHNDAQTALFNRTKRIFVREIIANVNGEDFPWLRANHLQQPEQGFAFVPVDVRLEFVNLFADEQAKLGCCAATLFTARCTLAAAFSLAWR